jgi:transposase
MARPYSTDLRDRVVASVASGRTCRATAALFGVSVSSVVKWSQRFRSTGSAAAYWMGGHRRRVLAGERDWLLARLTEKPDLTLRALVGELVERGIPASYGAVWRLLKAEGITVKKKPVRRRARSPRRGPPPGAMDQVSEADRPLPAGIHRRDLDQNQHGAAAGLGAARSADQGQGAAWSLADHDLPGCLAPRSHHRPLVL